MSDQSVRCGSEMTILHLVDDPLALLAAIGGFWQQMLDVKAPEIVDLPKRQKDGPARHL